MFDKTELIGKPYPVKDETGTIILWRPITAVYDMENMAGFAISLSPNEDSLLLISYKAALELVGE